MFLFHLNKLNSLISEQLYNAGVRVVEISARTTSLPRMEFLRSDHSTIPTEVPTHQMNFVVGIDTTLQECVNKVTNFVLDSADEFASPRIHMSNVYLNYDPKITYSDCCEMRFDIAIWEYTGACVRWLEVGNGQDTMRLGHDLGGYSKTCVKDTYHELLKQMPYEINVWTQNIARDIGFLTYGEGSTHVSAYLTKLEQELLDSARNAADIIKGMQRAGRIHDEVNMLFAAERYAEAAKALGVALDAPVDICKVNGVVYLEIESQFYTVDKVFALVSQLSVIEEDFDLPEDLQPLTDEQLAAGKIVPPEGVDVDPDEPNRQKHTIKAEIYRADGLPAGAQSDRSFYKTSGRLPDGTDV